MDLKWEAPPERAQRRGKYGEILDQLKQRPGEWAIIREFTPEDDRSTSPANRAATTRAYIKKHNKLPGTEVLTTDGKVYARFVGS